MEKLEPCAGWVLDYVTALDVVVPGIAGAYLRGSAERRQCIAALLSIKRYPADNASAQKLAEFLGQAGHRELLVAAFEQVPTGLRRALRRAGGQPHSRRFYPMLFRLLSNPPHSRIANALAQSERIDLARLRIIALLPEDLCDAKLVEAFDDVDTARDAIKLVELMASAGVDRADLTASLRDVASPTAMSNLWQRWALKACFPTPPVPASAVYKPVQSGTELKQIARRYRNCAASYLSRVLDGECAFAEFQEGGKFAIVHLSRTDGNWHLEGVLGPGNCSPGNTLRAAATEFMLAQGIKEKARPVSKPGPWRSLRRFTLEQFVDWDDL